MDTPEMEVLSLVVCFTTHVVSGSLWLAMGGHIFCFKQHYGDREIRAVATFQARGM